MSDIDIYEILVREHEQMLQGYLLVLVQDPELADELAQKAFIQAYQKLGTLKNKSSFAPWLRTIARNMAINDMKSRKNEIATDPEILQGMEDVFQAFDAPGKADSWAERVQAVKLCFEKLSETLRRTCRLHYMEDMKAREIADALSMSISAVLKSLERGRSSIRHCVEKRLRLENV